MSWELGEVYNNIHNNKVVDAFVSLSLSFYVSSQFPPFYCTGHKVPFRRRHLTHETAFTLLLSMIHAAFLLPPENSCFVRTNFHLSFTYYRILITDFLFQKSELYNTMHVCARLKKTTGNSWLKISVYYYYRSWGITLQCESPPS